ncbi:hypothetical protein ACEN9J_03200 [Variovorax sp. Varisp41]|uniref:hypothetical protein n=1 Tax=Variovorax sp. Varisp41 TaxID=3243033 RepID=UPI0039B4BB02
MALSIDDLNKAEQNTDFIDLFTTSTERTAVDRLGRTRTTLAGVEAYIGEEGILPSALAAQAGAEAAESGAVAAAESVGSFTTKALADAALAASEIPLNKGVYVTQDGGNNGFWVNRSGTLVRESLYTLPAVGDESFDPSWTGVLSGWVDTFFRNEEILSVVDGRQRWFMLTSSSPSYLSLVPNALYPGSRAMRLAANSGGNHVGGPFLYPDEFGSAPGDRVTVCGEIYADSGALVTFAFRAVDVNGNFLGDGQEEVEYNSDSQARVVRKSFVLPTNTYRIAVYPYTVTADKVLQLAACWAYKGDVLDGPAKPTVSDALFLKLKTAEQDKRIDQAMQPTANLGRLRVFRSIAARCMLPVPEAGLRIIEGFFGDSWTWEREYFLRHYAESMVAKLGDGGVGWLGFGFTPSVQEMGMDARGLYFQDAPVTGWTSNYHEGSTSPNLSDARSSTPGAVLKIASKDGATHPALSAVKLHFTGTANGVIRWRWNGGAWSANTNVQGGVGAQQTRDLTGFPTGALNAAAIRSITLDIEVVSGSVILCGADFQSATSGIVIHKLGSSGSTAADWASAMGAQYRAGAGALNLTTAHCLLMTNDQAAGAVPATAAAHVGTLFSELRTVNPAIDLMFTVPPENPGGYLTAMSDYAKALRAQMVVSKAAFLDLQPAFGDADNPDEYAVDGTNPLFKDDAHPNPMGGGIVHYEIERSHLWR